MNWLGIAVFAVFSLGLSLFMRLKRGEPRRLPPKTGQWQRVDQLSEDGDGTTYLERRLWHYDGGWVRPHRLVEQTRLRSKDDGRILEVLPERLPEKWRNPLLR